MKITSRLKVPTGDICVVRGRYGSLEFVSLGDYGKDVNLKCDALGLTRDVPEVKHTKLMPLTKKWVITISTQYGCAMRCKFCDAWKVQSGSYDATFGDMVGQILCGLHLHPNIKKTERLNIHFARMGEPTWNPAVLDVTKWAHEHLNPEYKIHPVVSTMMPKDNKWLKTFIHTWMRMKNRLLDGNAGLQLSINSTSEKQRKEMFSGNCLDFMGIYRVMEGIIPYGRKITLNFAIAGWEIDPEILLQYFDPDYYIIKLTPMHVTSNSVRYGYLTSGKPTTMEPYKEIEEKLKKAGYDVLVFIASEEEDKGMITCGNVILSGKLPTTKFTKVRVNVS